MELIDVAKMGGAGVLLFLLSLIKIPKIELNIWAWLGRGTGRVLNKELMNEVKSVSSEVQGVKKDVEDMRAQLDSHIEENREEEVRSRRRRVLRFSDEILYGIEHSKEHYDEVLEDIDFYENYCREHDGFKNTKCELSIKNIKDKYQAAMEEKNFYNKEE